MQTLAHFSCKTVCLALVVNLMTEHYIGLLLTLLAFGQPFSPSIQQGYNEIESWILINLDKLNTISKGVAVGKKFFSHNNTQRELGFAREVL